MRLILANGAKASVKSYTATTAVVNGNSVPALSLIVNEDLDTVRTLFNNPDNLSDFNIYEDDKNVVLLHVIGYQKRVGITLGDDENYCTVVLAKVAETDEILDKVEKALQALETTSTNQGQDIESLKSSVSTAAAAIQEDKLETNRLKTTLTEVSAALERLSETCVELSTKVSVNDKNITTLTASMQSATASMATFTNMIQGFKDSVDTVNSYSATAVHNVDKLSNSFTEYNEKLELAEENITSVQNAITAQAGSITTTIENLDKARNSITNISADISGIREAQSTFSSDVDLVKTGLDDANANIDGFNKMVEKTNEKVSDITKKTLPDIRISISQVGDRVSALEPIRDYSALPLDEAKAYRIKESARLLDEYLDANPITSNCHKGVAAVYSITKEKQTYLQNMITMATMAQAAGLDYQPSWNAKGEVCTYDWTLDELSQLAMEIEAVVRPLVSHQQEVEKNIQACETMNDLLNVTIIYGQNNDNATA